MLLEDLDAAFTRGISRDSTATGAPTAPSKAAAEASDGSTLSLSGLLNSLDGVAAAEGRCVTVPIAFLFDLIDLISNSLLFATTNHIERLDPALSRPGRMDVWVNFANATKWQAEGIFKCFFPSRPSASTTSDESESVDASQKNPPGSKRKASAHAVPILDESEIAQLAKRFADSIPEGEMSVCPRFITQSPDVPVLTHKVLFSPSRIQVASLQGYLLKNKTRPRECVEEVAEWCEAPDSFRFVLIVVDFNDRKGTTRA